VAKKKPDPRLLFVTEAARIMRRNVEDFKKLYIHSGKLLVVLEDDGRVMIDPQELALYIDRKKAVYSAERNALCKF
jgi:hypothetical protein